MVYIQLFIRWLLEAFPTDNPSTDEQMEKSQFPESQSLPFDDDIDSEEEQLVV